MNPLVLFILTIGFALGYGFARIQLRGRFLLALEAKEDAPLPPSWCPPDEAPLSQQWKLPPYRTEPLSLIRRPRCPEGYSAKQVLGYSDFGTPHPPQYPGKFEQWRKDHHDYYAGVDE